MPGILSCKILKIPGTNEEAEYLPSTECLPLIRNVRPGTRHTYTHKAATQAASHTYVRQHRCPSALSLALTPQIKLQVSLLVTCQPCGRECQEWVVLWLLLLRSCTCRRGRPLQQPLEAVKREEVKRLLWGRPAHACQALCISGSFISAAAAPYPLGAVEHKVAERLLRD
eukprot:299436-Pelagomonas_calceolata.AAC.5